MHPAATIENRMNLRSIAIEHNIEKKTGKSSRPKVTEEDRDSSEDFIILLEDCDLPVHSSSSNSRSQRMDRRRAKFSKRFLLIKKGEGKI